MILGAFRRLKVIAGDCNDIQNLNQESIGTPMNRESAETNLLREQIEEAESLPDRIMVR